MNIEKITTAKHICIKTDNLSFPNASAFYTYCLTLHKKVSIISIDKIDNKFFYLPWFDKVREVVPSSADMSIDIKSNTSDLFDFFKMNQIKINTKMATSLYSSLLSEYKNFQTKEVDGIVFALASELINLGAEHKLAYDCLTQRIGLNEFRLKAILFKNFILTKDATNADIYISDVELKSTGSIIDDVYPILEVFLTLINVSEVRLLKSDEDNKLVMNIKEK